MNPNITTYVMLLYWKNQIVVGLYDLLDYCVHTYLKIIQGVSYYHSIIWKRVYVEPEDWYDCYVGKDDYNGFSEVYTYTKVTDVVVPKNFKYNLYMQRKPDGSIACRAINRLFFEDYVINRKNNIDQRVYNSVFMSVLYRHPLLKDPVSLEVERGYYCEDNDLFTAPHVHRLLLYQQGPSVPFDEGYWLELFDVNKMELVTLKSDQYIHIFKNGYKILHSVK